MGTNNAAPHSLFSETSFPLNNGMCFLRKNNTSLYNQSRSTVKQSQSEGELLNFNTAREDVVLQREL